MTKRLIAGTLLAVATHATDVMGQVGAQRTFEVPNTEGMRWLKGNTHAHSDARGGDARPRDVAGWYKLNGYQFLVISDHDTFTNPRHLAHIVDSTFLLIGGEEVSPKVEGIPVHVTAMRISRVVRPPTRATRLGMLQTQIDSVRAAGGVPIVNHPNTQWALSHDLLAQVRDARLIEVFNGSSNANNVGSPGMPSVEEAWDSLLTGGARVYGVAADDAHQFKVIGHDHANPGRGWVVVRARTLASADIVRSLEAGLFYASTGVELDNVVTQPTRLVIHISQPKDSKARKYRTQFIGHGGRVLKETTENPAVYTLKGGETYVRAKVIDSNGDVAWVQPAFVVDDTRPMR